MRVMLRAVKGQRARREKRAGGTTKGHENVDFESEDSAEVQSQSQHAPVGLSLNGKRMEATRQREEKRRRCGGGWRERCDGGVKRREDYWATGGKRI